MGLKGVMQSWWSVGAFICACLAISLHIYPSVSSDSVIFTQSLYMLLWLTAIFCVPSTVLNWLYDRQNYAETQRHWMRAPETIFGKAGYIVSGAMALCCLLALGIGLVIFIAGGLLSLEQAAWST